MRYLGLCHSKTGAGLALQERGQPAGLLLLSAIAHQELHVPCVWSRAVEYLRRRKSASMTPTPIVKMSDSPGLLPHHIPSDNSWKFFLSSETCPDTFFFFFGSAGA
jgi:hypothetical protein